MITAQVNGIVHVSNGTVCYLPFEAEFRWDSADPLIVQLICHLPDADVTWAFGRELLFQGSTSLAPVGDGDVKIRREGPTSSRLIVCLSTTEGHADISVNQPHVVRFLNRTIAVTPIGEESLDTHIDELIEEIYNA